MLITPNVTEVPLQIAPSTSPKEMLSHRTEGGKDFIRVNYSSLSLIQTCPRKAQYSLERGLKAKSESPATLFGTAIHKALEVFYAIPRTERFLPANFIDHSNLLAFGHSPPNSHPLYSAVQAFVEKAEPLRALPDEDKRSISNGVWILQNYFKTYIDDPFEVFADSEGPILERSASLILFDSPELQIEIFGTIDAVLKNVQTGVLLPADHKTSSMVGNDFYNRLKPNAQYTTYLLLAKEVLGLDPAGFLVNCIEVKAKPKTARGSPPNFPRQVTTRSEEDFKEYKETVIEGVQSFLRWKRSGVWPLGSVDSCAFWGGCTYLDVCRSPSAIRENIIENNFITTKGN